MSLWQWYVRRGRIDRRTWWLHYTVPIGALTLLAYLADLALGTVSLPAAGSTAVDYGPVVIATVALTAPASVSANATRLHDKGLPALLLLLGLVPVVGQLGLFALNGFLRGDGGPNRYGPPSGSPAAPVEEDEPLYPPAHWS